MDAASLYETERLYLRPTGSEDAEFIFALMNSPKWIQYIGDRNIRDVVDAEAYILNKMSPQYERLGFGNYTLIRKADMVKIGTCGLYDREGLDGVDIGFAFLPQFEKQGYGFEAASKVKSLGFEVFNLEKISAITTKENLNSQKLLLKIGLKYSGMHTPPDDEPLMLFSEMNPKTENQSLKTI